MPGEFAATTTSKMLKTSSQRLAANATGAARALRPPGSNLLNSSVDLPDALGGSGTYDVQVAEVADDYRSDAALAGAVVRLGVYAVEDAGDAAARRRRLARANALMNGELLICILGSMARLSRPMSG